MKTIVYIIPTILLDILKLLRNLFKNLRNFKIIKRNARFRNIKKGKTIYIIANGPSLNNYDISSLYGKEVIVMNHFELADWKDKVKMVAHCFGEPSDSPAWEDPIPILESTDAASYWLHFSARAIVQKHQFPAHKTFNFVLPILPTGLWRKKGRINLASLVLNYQTTAQLAIMVAIYMGYKEINLLGFDHDWLCQRGISSHFYKESESVPKTDLNKFSYSQLIDYARNKWHIYFKLKASASNVGARIVNLSRPTYLDVFDYE